MLTRIVFAAALIFAAGIVSPRAASRPASADSAQQFVQELGRRQLTVIAARDPEQPDVYVAATLLPGVQLLAVSARTTAPAYLDQLLADKQFEQVYAVLNSAAVPEGKLFVQDMKADGLHPERQDGRSFDIVYQNVVKTILFNGDWKKQGMSKEQYRALFDQVDSRYTAMLGVLVNQARQLPTEQGAGAKD
jgi:hypothetical protein